LVVIAVQVIHALRDDDTLGVLPWAPADSIARIDSGLIAYGAGTQIGAPCLASRSHRCSQPLADSIRSRETTQICAVSGTRARDEETYIRKTLGERGMIRDERDEHDRDANKQ